MDRFNCLLVEDSAVMRQRLSMSIARVREIEVVEADDGVDAIKKLSEKRFDLVLVDINLPIMDGLKVIKHIRTNAIHAEVPVIVITTEGLSDTRERADKLGVQGYFTKPIDAPAIVAKARELLGID